MEFDDIKLIDLIIPDDKERIIKEIKEINKMDWDEVFKRVRIINFIISVIRY